MQSSSEVCQLVLVEEENIVKDGRSSIGSPFIISGEYSCFKGLSFMYLRIEIGDKSSFSEFVYEAKNNLQFYISFLSNSIISCNRNFNSV